MLARSLPGSARPSAPPSPRRRLAQPVGSPPIRSRLGSPLSSAPSTPPNAEFVGSSPAPPSAANGISETAFAPEYLEKYFRVDRELGRGGRGVVLLVQHVLDGVPLGQFACKRVPVGDDHKWLEKVLVEVQLLTQVSHQNLVSYRHMWLQDFQMSPFSPSVPCAFILQQYCNGGDLHNYICGPAQAKMSTQQLKERMRRRSKGEAELPRTDANEPKRLPLEEIHSFFKDITAGLRFLHLNGFIHRDLKPSNCLLHTVAGEARVLVSDFGEVQYESTERKSTGATGTISYCAPEVLQRVSADGPFGNFTFKSDIFSLGMILHFLCFASLPYMSANVLDEEREDVDTLRAEITSWPGFDERKKLRSDLPGELYSFLKRLLSIDPDYRPTADEVNRGISTGRLSDLMPELGRRRGSAGQGPFEELTPGKRIHKLDTPQEGNSPTRETSDSKERSVVPGLLLTRPARPLFNKRSRSRERANPSSKLAEETVIEDGDETDADRGRSPVASEERVSSSGSNAGQINQLDASIILRPRQRQAMATSVPTSPIHENLPAPFPSPSPERKAQLLLPPAGPIMPPTPFMRTCEILQTPVTSPLFKATVLLFKLLSLLQPCIGTVRASPLAGSINAAVVYPLIVLAVFEFSLVGRPRVWKSLMFGFIHVVALTAMMRNGALCTPSSNSTTLVWPTWEADDNGDGMWDSGRTLN
jgi:serine/threonine protein kinase